MAEHKRRENPGQKTNTKGDKMKYKSKKTAVASVVSILGLTAVLFIVAPASSSAQSSDGPHRGERIEGVWNSQVTLTDCQTGNVLATFRGLGMFIRGGSLAQTDNQHPGLFSPGFGKWQHSAGGHYTATFQFFTFNENGAFTGVGRVNRDIQLDRGGNTFSSVISSEIFDTNGNLIATLCGTETATRAE
jgi:hypothetical protein